MKPKYCGETVFDTTGITEFRIRKEAKKPVAKTEAQKAE